MDASRSALGRWEPMALDDVVGLMDRFPARWWVSGGLALELHVGRSWPSHEDTDVGICRQDVHHLRATLQGWEVVVASQGGLTRWDGEELSADAARNDLWCRRAGGPWRLDVTLGDGDDRRWVFRRDPSLVLPWRRVVWRTAVGVPYLSPAIQLLFKSKGIRTKDQIDAEVVIPALDPGSIALLDVRLPRDHPWATLVAPHRRGVTGADVAEIVELLETARLAVSGRRGVGSRCTNRQPDPRPRRLGHRRADPAIRSRPGSARCSVVRPGPRRRALQPGVRRRDGTRRRRARLRRHHDRGRTRRRRAPRATRSCLRDRRFHR